MKRILVLLVIIATYLSQAFAQQEVATADKANDTVVITEWVDSGEADSTPTHKGSGKNTNDFMFSLDDTINSGIGIALVSIILIFGLPFFIIFLAFFFKYKNRRAKYRLIEQALASGQPLPENFLKEIGSAGMRNNGITNIFTGLGLFIFLWAITGEFGVGCIGLLVLCIGLGQATVYYLQRKENDGKKGIDSDK